MSELSNTTTSTTASTITTSTTSRRASSPLARLLPVVATVVVGVAAGLVWLWLADPADWEAREGGIVLTEAAARGQFSVIVTFVVIGAVVSLAVGAVVARLLRDLGWIVAPVAIASTSAAALIAWQVGVHLGPPSPASVTGVAVGDRIPAELAVDGVAPFLVWPIFALVGVVVVTWLFERGRVDAD